MRIPLRTGISGSSVPWTTVVGTASGRRRWAPDQAAMARAWSSTAKRGVGRRAIERGHLVDQLGVRGGEARGGDRGPALAQEARAATHPDGGRRQQRRRHPRPAAACPPGSAGGCRAGRAGRPGRASAGPAPGRSSRPSTARRRSARSSPRSSITPAGIAGEVADRVRPRARGATSRCRGCRSRTTRWSPLERRRPLRRPDEARRRPAVEQDDGRAGAAVVVVDRLRPAPAGGSRPAQRSGARPRTRIPASSVAATSGLRVERSTSIARARRQPSPRAAVARERELRALGSAAGGRTRHEQVEAPELAGRRAGQGVDERHGTRHLVAGEVIADVVLDVGLPSAWHRAGGPRTP